MTYLGHVKDGQIALDEPAKLPEGARVRVHVVAQHVRVTSPTNRAKLLPVAPIRLPGDSLAEQLLRDRR